MQILDGKKLSEIIKSEIAGEVATLKSSVGKTPHLAAVLVGNDGASETYVASKVKSCGQTGIKSTLLRLPGTIAENDLLKIIYMLNHDSDVDGILVQLPLPKHISSQRVTENIFPQKDVDGFHPLNIGRMMQNLPCYIPATPYGILKLIERNKIETAGRHCVVIGRSNIVGSPMSILMSRNGYPCNCTVTLCHSKTVDLKEHTLRADIIIAALGNPGFVRGDMVKSGAAVIDVGITRLKDDSKKSGYRIAGDVNFEEVSPKCSFITPVPGGVGPMTIAGLLDNTLKAAKREIYP